MANAVDRNPLTAWRYALDPRANGVTNVGLVITLRSDQHPTGVRFATDTPGMAVTFYGAPSTPPASITDPGWVRLARRLRIATSATVTLGVRGRTFHALLALITHAPPGVNIGYVDISDLSLVG